MIGKRSIIQNPLVHIDDPLDYIRKPLSRFRIDKIVAWERGRSRDLQLDPRVQKELYPLLVEDSKLKPSPTVLLETRCMTELDEIFADLGISQYLEDFRSQGFDTWETILDITESDFDALGVKLGHRRKLQRKIANARGISSDKALGSPAPNVAVDDRGSEDRHIGGRVDGKDGGSGSGPHGAKRKYKRHPKPDINAPERPPSAYVIFSNKMRRDIEGQNLSFTEIAKLVGENWQALRPHEKEFYEQQANTQKEAYIAALMEYKKTQNYRDYDKYLKEFKAKQSNQRQAAEDAKRPKLESTPGYSSGTTNSGASHSSRVWKFPTLLPKQAAAAASTTASSSPKSKTNSPISQHGVETPPGRMPDASPTSQWQGSPSATPVTSITLPGYRDTVLAAPVQHTLAWREGQRDEPGPPQPVSSHMGYSEPHSANQFTHRSQNPSSHNPTPPPLISSESTATSTSTTSSNYYSPRTPIDTYTGPPLSYLTQKGNGSHENQLPPLQNTPSLSPQSTPLGPLQSPSAVQNFPPPQLPPVRDIYPHTPTLSYASRPREPPPPIPPANEDSQLDILAKAAELANQKHASPY